VLFLTAGLAGVYFGVREVYLTFEVRWWPAHECQVEGQRLVEVGSSYGFGTPDLRLRLELRDLETGRLYPDGKLVRHGYDFAESYRAQPAMAEYAPGVRFECRISPDGQTAVAEVGGLLRPFFIVLGVLFALVFAGLGVFALTTALFGDPLID